MKKILSPITRLENANFDSKVSVSKIVYEYQKRFDIDVSRFFPNQTEIQIYKCEDTGYKFYYPLNIMGDGAFYEHFQQFKWYYPKWKWEHEITFKILKKTDKILEMGCGSGIFLKKVADSGFDITGLEINKKAVRELTDAGYNVFDQTIQEYSMLHAGKYDILCSYQVVEHIADIKEIIDASLVLLKKGGRLIISVPNNDSLIMSKNVDFMNAPPHHVGLWNEAAFYNLDKFFPMKLDSVLVEPMKKFYTKWLYIGVLSKSFGAKRRMNPYLFYPLFFLYVMMFPNTTKGHTVQAQFIKQ